MGFLVLAKHGLNSQIGFKTKFGLKLGEKNCMERREGERKEEEEEEAEEEPKRYGFYDFWYEIVWIFGFCMKLCVFGPW